MTEIKTRDIYNKSGIYVGYCSIESDDLDKIHANGKTVRQLIKETYPKEIKENLKKQGVTNIE